MFGAGIVLLQSANSESKTELVKRRLRSNLPQAMYDRVIFVPRVTSHDFHLLLQISDVLLHPFPFGGSKTSSDAILSGTPLVIMPTGYLRGRMALGLYYELMVAEARDEIDFQWIYDCCIAGSVNEYISRALQLGNDKEYRTLIGGKISSKAPAIFDNESVVLEWLDFLNHVTHTPPSKAPSQPYEQYNELVLRSMQNTIKSKTLNE